MTNTNATNFRKNAFEYFDQTIRYNDMVRVTTKEGCAVVMSEEDYNGLMETIYLLSESRVAEELREGLEAPLDECLPEDEVEW